MNPLPSPVTPTPLEVCDIDNDGLAEFILTDKDDEIINGEPGVVVSYHETLFDAESGTLPLASPYANIDHFFTGCLCTSAIPTKHMVAPDVSV